MLDGFPLYFWEFLILNLPLYRLLMSNNLEFPKGIGTNVTSGQPYMLLTSYESKNAVDSVGQSRDSSSATASRGKIISSIALYIPPNALKTAFTADWGELEGATVKAAGLTAIDRLRWGNIWETLGAVSYTHLTLPTIYSV